MRWGSVAVVALMALAGCAGQTDPLDEAGTAKDVLESQAQAAANETLPLAGPALNPWLEAETQKVLFDATAEGGQCYELATVWEFLSGHYVMLGCVDTPLPDGVLLPVGTKSLRFDVDASQAQVVGGYEVFLYTPHHRTTPATWDTERTTEKVHTWSVDLVPDDWDPPTAKSTGAFMGLWQMDPVGGIIGPVKVKITAQRDPKWETLAPVDAWQLPASHKLVGAGVMNLLDANMTWAQPDNVNAGNQPWPEAPKLKDLVPYGARAVSVVLKWGPIQGCPQAWGCRFSSSIGSWGHGYKNQVDESVAAAGGWKIYTYKVPDEILEDPPYTKESGTQLYPFFWNCDPAACITGSSTGPLWSSAPKADVRFVVDAWQGEPNLDLLKTRLALA